MQETKEAARFGLHLQRFLIFILLVLAVVCVALYSFFNINPVDAIKSGFAGTYEKMMNAVEEAGRKVVGIPSEGEQEGTCLAALSGNLVVASVSSVKCFDREGNLLWHVPVNLKKPLVQNLNDDILVADIGGRYLGIIRDGTVLWEKNLDADIVNAGIYENWVLVITASSEAGYRRVINAFSADGQKIAYRNVSDYYPFAVYYFPQFDNTSFAVCGVDVNSLETASLFEFLDLSMNQKGSIRDSQESGNLFAGAMPFSDGKLLLYGGKGLMCVDRNLSVIWQVDLDGDYLTTCAVTKDDTAIAAVLDGEAINRDKQSKTRITAIDGDGTVKELLTVDSEVTRMKAKGRTIAFVAGSQVYFIDSSGDITDTYTSNAKIDDVCLAAENLAYILSDGKLVSVKVNVPKKFLGIF